MDKFKLPVLQGLNIVSKYITQYSETIEFIRSEHDTIYCGSDDIVERISKEDMSVLIELGWNIEEGIGLYYNL